MKNSTQSVCERIKELREILDISAEKLAEMVGISVNQYNDYENGVNDIPIGVIYTVANSLNVDSTVLLTGEAPRMNAYTVVRESERVSVDRYMGYTFSALATNFINRDMDPMIVEITAGNNDAKMVCHAGQEFNYVLEGVVRVIIGKHDFELAANDSIYFDARVPHAQYAASEKAKFLTVINE